MSSRWSGAVSSTAFITCSVARCRRWTASVPTSFESVSSRRGSPKGEIHEVVIATDPDVEGEATAYYVAEQLASLGVTVSRPAHGLPAGSDLEYADELTMARAFAGRRAL